MAQTPFSTTTVATAGLGLPRVIAPQAGLRSWWLGRPGNLIQLPYPTNGYDAAPTLNETSHSLLGGGVAVTRIRDENRTWQLNWGRLGGRDYQVVHGFYRRAFGNGPWCLVAPEDSNRLGFFASLCGTGNGALEGWATTVGTAVYDSTVTSPVLPSGVIRWSGAGSGSQLVCGPVVAGVATPDATASAPYVPAAPTTVSLWAWCASGTVAATLRVSGRLANGTVATEASASITLTTTPQRFTVTAAAGTLGAALYVLPILVCNAAGAVNILAAAPQLEYVATATEWAAGTGSPRVVIAGPPTRNVSALLMSAQAMTLSEV